MMRTTVRLNDELFREARKTAIDQRMTFSDMVDQALRNYLGKQEKKKAQKTGAADFLIKLADYKLKGGPKDLAQKHDKYTWEL